MQKCDSPGSDRKLSKASCAVRSRCATGEARPSCGDVGIPGSGIGAQGLQEEPLLFCSSQP